MKVNDFLLYTLDGDTDDPSTTYVAEITSVDPAATDPAAGGARSCHSPITITFFARWIAYRRRPIHLPRATESSDEFQQQHARAVRLGYVSGRRIKFHRRICPRHESRRCDGTDVYRRLVVVCAENFRRLRPHRRNHRTVLPSSSIQRTWRPSPGTICTTVGRLNSVRVIALSSSSAETRAREQYS